MSRFGVCVMTGLLAALIACPAAAAPSIDVNKRETKSRFDPRIRVIEYNPLAIVTIRGVFGYSTHIQFAADEEVTDVASGDSLAWEIAPSKNHLFVKPREPDGRTNAAVITNKRLYQFVLDSVDRASAKPEDIPLFIIFTYESDPAIKQTAQVVASQVKETVTAMEAKPDPVNRDYAGCRKNAGLNPAEAWDDGRFTYFRFGQGQPLPVIHTTLPDGSTAIPNGRIDGKTMVIFETSPKFIVRLGDAESCIVNHGYGKDRVEPVSGSSVDGVMRTLRSGNNE